MNGGCTWGRQVGIRFLGPSDAVAVHRFMTDPEVARLLFEEHLGIAPPVIVVALSLGLSNVMRRPDYGIVLRETGRLIGSVRLWRLSDRNRSAMLTIFIGEKEFWGRGYGTEALQLVLREAFGRFALNRVELHVFDFNSRAIRSYEKVGFVREGVRRKALRNEEGFCDIVVMGLLKGEFIGLGSPGEGVDQGTVGGDPGLSEAAARM